MWSWAGVVAAGILNGSFAVPLKTARVLTFNHIWMVHSLLAMSLLPWTFALLMVPRWSGILGAVPVRGWATSLPCVAAWATPPPACCSCSVERPGEHRSW